MVLAVALGVVLAGIVGALFAVPAVLVLRSFADQSGVFDQSPQAGDESRGGGPVDDGVVDADREVEDAADPNPPVDHTGTLTDSAEDNH